MNFFNLDFAILKFFNQYFYSDAAYIMLLIISSVYLFIALLFFFFFVKKQKAKLVQLALALAIGYLLIVSLKYIVDRPRPYQSYPEIKTIIEKTDPSFPSTHAFFSLLCYSFIPKRFRKFVLLYAIYFLLLIPLGLVYTGVHYPSDVIVGAAIGLLIPRTISEKFSSRLVKKLSF
jgi:undecaprenyl-diphosphatase